MDNSTNIDKTKLIKLAQMYFKECQWDKALTEQSKILSLDRNDPDSLAAVGDIYAKKKSVQLAFEFYFKAAPIFLIQGRSDQALLVYQKITHLDLTKLSSDVRMNMNIFKGYVEIDEILKDKRYEIAIAPLGKLLKLRPHDPMSLALLKDLSHQIDQITPSIARYELLGDSFLKNGILDKAWDMYRKIVEMDPQKLPILLELAKTFQKYGHDSEAKKAYLYLAELALTKDDLNGAVEFVQKAIELKSLEAGYILGLVHFKKRQWSEAKTEFEKLIRIKVNHLGGLIHLAKTFAFLSQPDKANETLQKAFKVDENNVLVQEAWVEFCLQGSNQEMAIPHLTLLLEKAIAQNETERTIQFSRMMIQVRPDLISPRVKLVEALQTRGDAQGASDACRALAMICEEQGLLNDSAQWLEKANTLYPVHSNMANEPAKQIPSPPPSLPVFSQVPTMLDIPEIPLDLYPVQEIPIEDLTAINSPEPPLTDSTWPVTLSNIPEIPIDSPPNNVIRLKEMPPEAASSKIQQEPLPPPDEIREQLATAQLCVEQGLYKAAIEIYQQILRDKPDSPGVRQNLHQVNSIYLKKWVESQK